MANVHTISASEDEIIFSARYSLLRVWFSVIVAFLFPMYLFFYAAYAEVLRGAYILAATCCLMGCVILLMTLDAILFKALLFYADRVVKVWHLFGRRTIYYSRAKVIGPPKGYEWVSSGHAIRETRTGRDFLLQVPISFMAFFFSSGTSKKIASILDYLTGDKEKNPRISTKSILPAEVIAVPKVPGIHN